MQSNFIAENKPFAILLVISLILLIRLLIFPDKPDSGDVVEIVVDDTSVSIPPEFDQDLLKRDTEGVALVSKTGQIRAYEVTRTSPASLDPIDLCDDKLEGIAQAESCKKRLPMTTFVEALSSSCYSCNIGGVQRYCHKSSSHQYYQKYPCKPGGTHHSCPPQSECQ